MKKKALVSSILTIALCVCLIAGSTLALFTSESTVNVAVTAGKVDVTAEIKNLKTFSRGNETEDGIFENGGTASIDGDTLTLDRMTPGDKVTADIVITNESTVKVQYQTVLKGIAPEAGTNLLPGLKVTVDSALAEFNGNDIESDWKTLDPDGQVITVPVEIELPWNDQPDNTYQDASCKLVYTVNAVQGNAPVKKVNATVDATADVNAAVKELAQDPTVKTINLTVENDTAEAKSVSINNWDLNGKDLTVDLDENVTFSINNVEVKNGQTLTFKGEGTIKNGLIPVCSGGTLIIEDNVKFVQDALSNDKIELAAHGATVILRNCTLENDKGVGLALIAVGTTSSYDTDGVTPSEVILENVTLDNHMKNGNPYVGIYVFKGALNITAENTTFNGSSDFTTAWGKRRSEGTFLLINPDNECSATINGVEQVRP